MLQPMNKRINSLIQVLEIDSDLEAIQNFLCVDILGEMMGKNNERKINYCRANQE